MIQAEGFNAEAVDLEEMLFHRSLRSGDVLRPERGPVPPRSGKPLADMVQLHLRPSLLILPPVWGCLCVLFDVLSGGSRFSPGAGHIRVCVRRRAGWQVQ